MPDPDFPPRASVPLRAVVTACLATNLLLGVALWRVHRANVANSRRIEVLGRLVAAGPRSADNQPPAGGKAGREERVAFLLASAGNADQSKQILEAVSVPEAVEMARALLARPGASDRNAALDAVFQKIAGSDPTRAAALLAEVSEPTLRNTLAVRVASLWIEQSPDAAARWLDASGETVLSQDAFDTQLARAVARWAAYDPAAATTFLAARKTLGAAGLAALAGAGAEWGRKDATSALAWAQGIPPADPRRFGLIQNILAGWAEREPARAAAYLQERLFDGGEGNDLYLTSVGLVAERWAKLDLNAAAQWALTLPGDRVRRDALRRVATAWVAADFPGAARWAGTLPAGTARGDAWQVIVASWPGNDFDGEGAWVSSLPAGPDRDATVAIHAAKIARTDPEKALVWARSINGPEEQARSVGAILAGWQRGDPAAARNWAAANGVALP